MVRSAIIPRIVFRNGYIDFLSGRMRWKCVIRCWRLIKTGGDACFPQFFSKRCVASLLCCKRRRHAQTITDGQARGLPGQGQRTVKASTGAKNSWQIFRAWLRLWSFVQSDMHLKWPSGPTLSGRKWEKRVKSLTSQFGSWTTRHKTALQPIFFHDPQ